MLEVKMNIVDFICCLCVIFFCSTMIPLNYLFDLGALNSWVVMSYGACVPFFMHSWDLLGAGIEEWLEVICRWVSFFFLYMGLAHTETVSH